MDAIRLSPYMTALLLAGTLASAGAPAPSSPAETAETARPPPASAQCKEAVVSPVSGYAECVDPRGAPVAPPPKRPDAPAPAPAPEDR
jgi:hypothetical protein